MWDLQSQTTPAWIDAAMGDFDALLIDHCHCEKKAAASAMMLVSHYPDHDVLVRRCVKLAQEELRHFQQVHELIVRRGLSLGRDWGDPYAKTLLEHCRKGGDAADRLTDKLLVCGLIEARSCERLAILGEALGHDTELGRFYRALAAAEAGHHRLFVELACLYQDQSCVAERWDVLAERESDIIQQLPLLPRVH